MGVSVNRVFLSLGSNIDKERNLPAAVALLRQWTTVLAVSSAYETPPKGLTTQPSFLNAAVLIETPLNAEQIKEALIERVEQALGRERTADKNAPRTIDLDISLFNDEVFDYLPSDGRSRHVPDPDLLIYAHAIVPLAELAPDERHPETNELLAELALAVVAADVSGEGELLRRDEIAL